MQAKGVTAIGIWLLICMSFVTMSLFEYAALLKIRFYRTRKVKKKTSEMIKKMTDTADEELLEADAYLLCATIDKVALVVFVIAFFVASLIYWIWYSTKYE